MRPAALHPRPSSAVTNPEHVSQRWLISYYSELPSRFVTLVPTSSAVHLSGLPRRKFSKWQCLSECAAGVHGTKRKCRLSATMYAIRCKAPTSHALEAPPIESHARKRKDRARVGCPRAPVKVGGDRSGYRKFLTDNQPDSDPASVGQHRQAKEFTGLREAGGQPKKLLAHDKSLRPSSGVVPLGQRSSQQLDMTTWTHQARSFEAGEEAEQRLDRAHCKSVSAV
jgi:hypothetical protein